MNEGLLENPALAGPVEEDMELEGEVFNEIEVRTEVADNGKEKVSEVPPSLHTGAPSDSLDVQDIARSAVLTGNVQAEKVPGAAADEAPIDWFEPLEDDDYEDDTQGWNLGLATGERRRKGMKDAEEESVAGSERSESVAGSERNMKNHSLFSISRRGKNVSVEDGWVDCPALGGGWKRKSVVRRSGTSVGQCDVYYMSPSGKRVRSRIELSKILSDTQDMTMFDFKAGIFRGAGIPKPLRFRKKNAQMDRSPSVDGGFSSESSVMDKGDGADSPDSRHRLTPLSRSSTGTPSRTFRLQHTTPPRANSSLVQQTGGSCADLYVGGVKYKATQLPRNPTSSLSMSINGNARSEPCFCICAVCGNSYTGFEYERNLKTPCCPICKAKNPAIASNPVYHQLRKWIPCGNCRACLITEDCGSCANCKKTLNPDSRKPVRCRKRICLCPIRKYEPDGQQSLNSHATMNIKIDSRELQSLTPQYSDPEDYSVDVDIEDDDEEFDGDDADYEAWVKKRKRRSCGNCDACNSQTDCGTCDFCIDKPKFGGSNKKRQKCRLRQCQRQAMRHLLPFQLGQTDIGSEEGWVPLGRPRPHTAYSRKTTTSRSKTQQLVVDLDFDDDDDDIDLMQNEEDNGSMETSFWRPLSLTSAKLQDGTFRNHIPGVQEYKEGMENGKQNGLREAAPDILNLIKYTAKPRENTVMPGPDRQSGTNGALLSVNMDDDPEEETPMITQIFSLAANDATSGIEKDHELLKLLEALRSSALPTLWFAIMVEGPMLQLLQCSKLSRMVDTTLHIDQGFCFQICVQGQPLLPTHSVYESHPTRLTTVTLVVDVLLDLEKYNMCQGVPAKKPTFSHALIITERASTCDFLVLKDTEHCPKCIALSCG